MSWRDILLYLSRLLGTNSEMVQVKCRKGFAFFAYPARCVGSTGDSWRTVSPNSLTSQSYTVLVPNKFSHEHAMPLATLINLAERGRDKNLFGLSHTAFN